MENNYYVYEWIRLDTNEPFYVGKGNGKRWKRLTRGDNNHFNNIVKSTPITVVIVKDNLTEAEAFYWEEEIIRELVFDYGFSIDIEGNRSNDHYCHLTNKTWGGEGTSGHNPFENKTEEEMKEIKRKYSEIQKIIQNKPEVKKRKSKKMKGEKNPMYGKNPLDYMTEEAKKERGEKISEVNKGENNYFYGKHFYGELNPMYGKHHTKESIRKMEVPIICLTTKRIFYGIKEAGKFYKIKSCSHISSCCRGERKSCGKYNGQKLVWRYLVWQHDKRLRPLNK